MADAKSLSLMDLEKLLQEEDGLLTPVNTETNATTSSDDPSMEGENSIANRLRRLEELGSGVTRYKDTAGAVDQLLDFMGEAAWGFQESASFGVLDVATLTEPGKALRKSGIPLTPGGGFRVGGSQPFIFGTDESGRYRPWEEDTFAGNAGYIVGSGLGMMVPITGWMKGLSFLTRASRGLTATGKARRTASISEKLAAKYATKKGAAQMQQTVANLGDDAFHGIVRESDELLGFSSKNPLFRKRFKQIIGNNVKALDDATAGMRDSIKKFAPELSELERNELASEMLEIMIKHDPGDIHRILSNMPLINKLGPRKRQLAVAAASNFTTGLIYHTGNEAMGNLTFATANALGLEIDDKESKMHPGLWKNKEGIAGFLRDARNAGLGFAAIAPAHFVRGGRATPPSKELWNGLKNMGRSLKRIGKLSDGEAISRVRLMEDAAMVHGGISLRNFVKHEAMNTPTWINTLTGDQAKSILFQTRKQFAKEWLPYIGSEIGKDFIGSLPRMIAGSMLMQLPHLIHTKGDIGDPKEFATHVMTGMYFAKKGQIFKKGRKLGWGGEHIWQTTQKPESYSATPKRAKAMHAAMTYMGMPVDMPQNRESIPQSILRSAMEETGEWRYIKEIVKDYYTEDVKTIPGAKDIESAYRDKIKSMGEEMTPHKEQQLQNALKILLAFEHLGPHKNEAFRDVTPEEAFEIVESISKAPNVGSHKNNIDAWIDTVEGKTLSIAAQKYIDPIVKFLANTMDTLGFKYTIDEHTNKITMPSVNIDKVIHKMPPGPKRVALMQAVEAFNYQVQEGIKDGLVTLDTRKEVTLLNNSQHKSLLEGLNAAVVNLNEQSGIDVSRGAEYGFDPDIMTNPDMRYMYRQIKDAEQRNNFLSVLAPSGQESSTYNTLSERVRNEVDKNIEALKLDRPVKFIMTDGQNPNTQQNVVSTYNKLRELYSRINGKYQEGVPEPITISEVNSKLDNLFGPAVERVNKDTNEVETYREGGVFGDILTNNKSYSELLNSMTGEFMKRMQIEDATNSSSIMAGMTYLINGSIVEKSGSEGTAHIEPGGKFARTSERGVVLPESITLFKALKPHLSPDQAAELMPAMQWYESMQGSLKATGGMVKFSANAENAQKIIKSYGVDGLIQFLSKAKTFSDLGKVENLLDAPEKLQSARDGISRLDEIMNTHLDAGTVDVNVINLLKPKLLDFFNSLNSLQNSFDTARLENNMPWLLAVEGQHNNFSNMLKNVEQFLNIDASVEGNITTAYTQKVAQLAMEAANMSRIQTGQVNIENQREIIQREINSESKNLPDKQHSMEINISPQKFQTKYAMYPHLIEKVMANAYEAYHNPGGGGVVEVINSFDNLIVLANQSAIGAGLKVNQADLITDSIQMIGNRVFRKKIKTIQLKNELGELGEAFVMPSDRLGLDGINNKLDLNNDYYKFGKDIITTDALGVNRKAPLNRDKEASIDANMESGLGIDNIRNESLVLAQAEGVEIEMHQKRKLMRVVFGEVSALYPISETKIKIQDAYKEGGTMYLELAKILEGTSAEGNARLAELSKKFTSDMTVDQLKDALNYTWSVLNMPHIVLETSATMDYSQSLDAIKRRKMTHLDKGKMLTQDYYDFLLHSYERGAIHSNIFADMNNLLKSIAPDGDITTKRQRYIPINDEAGTLTVRNIAERVYDRYVKDGIITEAEKAEMISEIDKDVSSVNSATFLTRKAFNIELAKMGARPEWFIDGNINMSKIGALKPKGVHVSVDNNGRMVVFYNKTAMFFDKEIAGYLESEGMDGVVFKSGNKINKYRENKTGEVISRMTEPSMHQGNSIGEIVKERIIQGNKDGSYLDLPYDTHVTNNISREHLGTVGSNTGVHFPHSIGIEEWMNSHERIQQFKDLLISSRNSEYAAAHVLEQLLMRGRDVGDAQYDRLPYEVMLQESGLILQPHLQDVAFDRLFKFFFEGGKIATNSVPNSSYNAMMPDVMTKIGEMDLPVRTGGSQRIIGGYVASDFDMSSIYKKFNVSTPDNHLQHVGSTLATRVRYADPKSNMSIKEADIVVLPDGKELKYIVDGWFIDGENAIDLAYRGRGDSQASNAKTKDMIAVGILEGIAKDYNTIMDGIGPEHTYRDVLKSLGPEGSTKSELKWDIVNAQSRQPRNSMNDFLLTKVKDVRDSGDGNASAANIIDVLRTQDADHDFDKSSSYQSAPKDVFKHAAANGGLKTSMDSYTWADEIVAKLNVDMSKTDNLNASLRSWLLNHENVELARGQFVKLHNVASYILNAFPNNGTIAKHTVGNKTYEIRAKTDSAYYKSVDQITHWVKLFIDSYKKTMNTDVLSEVIDDLMLGSKKPIDDSGQMLRFNGLFEVVTIDKNGIESKGVLEDPAVRDIIKYNILSPIKKYLRHNRGESIDPEALGGLKLDDIANGWSDFMFEIGAYGKNQELWISGKDKAGDRRESIDLSIGMKSLREYITKTSQNPFDRAMKQLFEIRNEAESARNSDGLSLTNSILLKAEKGLLSVNEKGVEADTYDVLSVHSNRLWNHVQKDHDYAKYMSATRRLANLKDTQEYYTAEPREVNAKKLKDLEKKILFYEELIADAEIRMGAEYHKDNQKPSWSPKETVKKEAFVARTAPIVVWSKEGKIKEVIRVGQSNKQNIYKTDMLIQSGKRFELADVKEQTYLKSRSLAFNDLPFIDTANGRITIDSGQQAVLSGAMKIFREKLQIHKDDLKAKRITPGEYSIRAQGELHRILNGHYRSGVDSELMRKGIIWQMLAPSINRDVIVQQKSPDGTRINDNKYYENAIESKVVEGYLMGVGTGEKFSQQNTMTSQEASKLMKEIASRTALSHLALSKPEMEVVLDLGIQGQDWYKQRNMKDVQPNVDIYKGNGKDPVAHVEALGIISDFIGQGKLISPQDMHKLGKIISENTRSGVPMGEIFGMHSFSQKRHFGNYGESPAKAETHDAGLKRILERYRQGCQK